MQLERTLATGWIASFTSSMLREDIGDVSLYKRDPNYLCLYTNCDTATFYGGERA